MHLYVIKKKINIDNGRIHSKLNIGFEEQLTFWYALMERLEKNQNNINSAENKYEISYTVKQKTEKNLIVLT